MNSKNVLILCLISSTAVLLLGDRAIAQGPISSPVPVIVTNNGGSSTSPVRVVGPDGNTVPVAVNGIPTVKVGGIPTVQVGTNDTVNLSLIGCFSEGSDLLSSSDAPTNSYYTVPAGKRLIIQHVSAVANIPQGQKLTLALNNYNSLGSGILASHFLQPILMGTFFVDADIFVAAGPMVMNADEGTRVQFSSRRNGTASSTGSNKCISLNTTSYLVPKS